LLEPIAPDHSDEKTETLLQRLKEVDPGLVLARAAEATQSQAFAAAVAAPMPPHLWRAIIAAHLAHNDQPKKGRKS
jgi:hypothetical protein